MKHSETIEKTIQFVKSSLKNAESGHDWWHAYRVNNISIYIAKKEAVEHLLFPIQLAAFLHDIADSKFHNGDETVGITVASNFLKSINVDPEIVDQVIFVIKHISYKGGFDRTVNRTQILDIVQDADRLDAMGAIGIARTFNYGGHKNRPLFDPENPPRLSMTKEEYKLNSNPTLNHFQEKLFKLKSLMNTITAQEMAVSRHTIMEQFVANFLNEWNFNTQENS